MPPSCIYKDSYNVLECMDLEIISSICLKPSRCFCWQIVPTPIFSRVLRVIDPANLPRFSLYLQEASTVVHFIMEIIILST